MQSKRPINLRNVLDSLHLLLYIPLSLPVDLRKHRQGSSAFRLLAGQGRWEALVEDWRMGET